jgi:enoyl-CoA hydratase/carnithine racemase
MIFQKLLTSKIVPISFNNIKSLSTTKTVLKRDDYIQIKDDEVNQLRRIVMCDVKRRNALGLSMINYLQEAVDDCSNHKNIRVIVLASALKSVFSSGHNLKELTTEHDTCEHEKVFKKCMELCLSLKNISIPTIAEVEFTFITCFFSINF